MGIIGVFVRFAVGLLSAFCWSIVGGIVGISSPGSAAFPVYGIGAVIAFIFGLRFGGKLANKWFPINEERAGMTKDEEASMEASFRKLTGRDKE